MASDTKKKGFFHRLSLSSSKSQPNGVLHKEAEGRPRVVSSSKRGHANPIAGPAYHSLPPGAAPSSYDSRQAHNREPGKEVLRDFAPHPVRKDVGLPVPPMPPVQAVPVRSNPTTPRTPPTQPRNPIHPALASPPKQQSQSPPSSHPYDVKSAGPAWRQSYSTPPGMKEQPQNGRYTNADGSGSRNTRDRTVSQPRSPTSNSPSMAPLAAALPKSMSNASGRFSDADGPTYSTPPIVESPHTPGTHRSAKSPPISSRNKKQTPVSTTSPTSPVTPTHRTSVSNRQAAPALPHTRTSYFTGVPPLAPQTSQSLPQTPPSQRQTPSDTPRGISEAHAYALSISSNLAKKSPLSRDETSSAPPERDKSRKSSRPLPRPPQDRSASGASTIHVSSSRSAPQRVAGVDLDMKTPNGAPAAAPPMPSVEPVAPIPVKVAPPVQQNGHSPEIRRSIDKPRPTIVIPEPKDTVEKRVSRPPYEIDFPRSPTLPALVDPRLKDVQQKRETRPEQVVDRATLGIGGPGPPPAASVPARPQENGTTTRKESLPARRSSALPKLSLGGHTKPSPGLGHILTSPTQMSPRSPPESHRYASGQSRRGISSTWKFGRPAKPNFAYLLAHPTIQAALLPWLTINSFLSLTGCSELVRKQLSGETVGRWVLREWGISVEREKGRSWPNLTVWEGFLESLLHDPATYCTYPPQWHSLLQHLSLSHTLIVLHLRNLSATCFPNAAPLPFEDEFGPLPMPFSQSATSLSSMNLPLPRSRVASLAGSDAGSIAPSSAERHGPPPTRDARLVEIVMPEPLAAKPKEDMTEFQPPIPPKGSKLSRKGSRGSIVSTASLGFGRKRAASISQEPAPSPVTAAAPMPGKATLPPVSFPAAKRYTFTRHGDQPTTRSRTMSGSSSSRPGSIFSMASSPAASVNQRLSIGPAGGGRRSFAIDRNAPPVPAHPATMRSPAPGLSPTPNGHAHRGSFASDGRSINRISEFGNQSPVNARFGSPFPGRDGSPGPRIEQAFERAPPYIVGRAPILRVFVALSERVRKWPSAEGAAAAVRELDKCGATRRLKLGDLVVNTAYQSPQTTEHVLLFVPFIKHLLVPLEYKYCKTGHLPAYLDAFQIPPSYYYPFLPPPQIIFLNLAPWCIQAMGSIRLAFDRRDVTTASGTRISAKRYLHVTGFEIKPDDGTAPEWQGIVSLESEGTAEGKMELERRLGGGDPNRAMMGAWEVIREKSMMGNVWLKLVKDDAPTTPIDSPGPSPR